MPVLDRGVQAAVSVCAYPQQMLVMAYNQGSATTVQSYYYRVPELVVEHQFPWAGLHSFDIRTKSDMGLLVIESLFQGISASILISEHEITQLVLDTCRTLCSDDPSAAVELLVSSGVKISHANIFIQSLAVPRLKLVLQYFPQVKPAINQKMITILAGEEACWVIQATAFNAARLSIQAMPVSQVLEFIHSLHQL